jgi:hypothetical protein
MSLQERTPRECLPALLGGIKCDIVQLQREVISVLMVNRLPNELPALLGGGGGGVTVALI